jgi:hypothetical protein
MEFLDGAGEIQQAISMSSPVEIYAHHPRVYAADNGFRSQPGHNGTKQSQIADAYMVSMPLQIFTNG